jgi:vacuolar-type H+-ATPase subunit F/Vma7
MTGIHVIADAETVLAFALGGVPGSVVTTAAEVRAALAAAAAAVRARGRDGRRPLLLLISRRMAALANAEVHALTLDPTAPLVLVIAGYGEPGGEVADDFVQRALGMQR